MYTTIILLSILIPADARQLTGHVTYLKYYGAKFENEYYEFDIPDRLYNIICRESSKNAVLGGVVIFRGDVFDRYKGNGGIKITNIDVYYDALEYKIKLKKPEYMIYWRKDE